MAGKKDFKGKVKDLINDVKDDSKSFKKKEIESGKALGILSYIIPFIPYLVEKDNKYVKYHANQGMNLLVISIGYSLVYWFLSSIIKVNRSLGSWHGYAIGTYEVTPWWVTYPLSLIGIGITALCVIGIVNVCNGKAKELPIVNKVKVFK